MCENKKVIIYILLLFTCSLYGQYYYSGAFRGSRATGIIQNVYRINLKTGEKELVLIGVGSPRFLPEINKIVFRSIPQLEICIYDGRRDVIDTLSYLGKYEALDQIHTVPPDSNIFLGLIKLDAKIIDRELLALESTELLLDKEAYSVLDTSCYYYKTSQSVFSRDGRRRYSFIDSTRGIFFKSIDTKSAEVINDNLSIEGLENLNIYGGIGFYSSSNGYAFLGYLTKDSEDRNLTSHYILCDPENRICPAHLIWQTGTHPYAKTLTSVGDMVFQDGGNIYIYDKNTAELKQRLKFQTSDNPDAESKIFILGDSLYFFPEDPEKSDATHFDNIGHADITKVQSNTSLAEMMTDDVENAYHKGWIDNKGIYNSLRKKLQNAQKQIDKGKPKQAINQLNAFLNHLESQKGKHVNEQAYNLLHFNAKALIKRLEE